MVYTESEKRKLDNILNAFSDFIREQNYFDIVYSEKLGYIRILVRDYYLETPQTLATVQEMLETLCYEIVADAVFAPDNKQNRLTAEAETKIERRLTEIVRRMGEDKDCCLDYIDNYMKKYLEDYK